MNALLPPLAETRARTTNQGLDAQYIRNKQPFDWRGLKESPKQAKMKPISRRGEFKMLSERSLDPLK